MVPSEIPETPGITQPETGYRFSLDPFLLADFIDMPHRRVRLVADLGAGSGILTSLTAKKYPAARFAGFDICRGPLVHARKNLPSGLFVNADIRTAEALVRPGSFDLAVSNPPYRRAGNGRLNPHPAKAVARHEVSLTLPGLVSAARHILRHRGIFCVVHLAERSAELLHRLADGGFAPLAVRHVYSREGEAAFLALVSAVKGGRNPVAILPPLYVYASPGRYSAEMAAIYKKFDAPALR